MIRAWRTSRTSRALRWLGVALAIAPVAALPAQSCTTGSSSNGSCTVAVTVSLTINKTTQLVVSSSSTFSLLPSAGVLTATDYNAGFYDVASILTVTGSSNATWGATIASNTATFGAPCASKPASQLLWGRTAVTRSTPMSTSAAPVFPLASNVATAGLSQSLYFRVQVGWTTDPPSACSIGISFTITAP